VPGGRVARPRHLMTECGVVAVVIVKTGLGAARLGSGQTGKGKLEITLWRLFLCDSDE
jgi:TM2 domain-containing membrane protein YozV